MHRDAYYRVIDSAIRQFCLAVAEDVTTYEDVDEDEGHIVSRITFKDGSYLDFEERFIVGDPSPYR